MAQELVDPRCKLEEAISFEGELVKILVGPDHRQFYLPKAIFCAKSPFFEAALSKSWVEGQERKVTLPEEDADAFHCYTQWLLLGRIPCLTTQDSTAFLLLAKLYVLGDRVMDSVLKDRALDAIIASTRQKDNDGSRTFPGKDVVKFIYDSTSKDSPARRLMVDMWSVYCDARFMTHTEVELPYDFLFDLSIASFKGRVPTLAYKIEHVELDAGVPCSYHQHAKGEPCAGKRK